MEAIEFMKHWRECCKVEDNCKGCFIEHECQRLTDKRTDADIARMIDKIEKRILRKENRNV